MLVMMFTAPASVRMPILNWPASTGTEVDAGFCSMRTLSHGHRRLPPAGAHLPRRGDHRRADLHAPRRGLGARLSRGRHHHRPVGPAPHHAGAHRAGIRRARHRAAPLPRRPRAQCDARVAAAPRDLRPRRGAGAAHHRRDRAHRRRARAAARRRRRRRHGHRDVIDRHRACAARGKEPAAHAGRPGVVRGAPLPGPRRDPATACARIHRRRSGAVPLERCGDGARLRRGADRGRTPRRAADAGLFALARSQAGEFAFVLFSAAANVLPAETIAVLNASVALSMLTTPLLMMLDMRYRATIEQRAERAADAIAEANPVIIAGFGRFGQVVTRVLRGLGIRATVIDHDPEQIETVRRFGFKAYYGDATRMDLLESAGARKAKLLLVAIDEPEAAMRMVKRVRQRFPRLEVVVRANGRTDAYEYAELGVPSVRETFGS